MKKDNKNQPKKAKAWYRKIMPIAALLLIITGFLAYSNSFDTTFHWDDLPQIVNRDVVHDPGNFLDFNAWRKVNLRPFSQLTFAINYALGGQDATGYHLVNLLLHILTGLLVFLLTRLSIGLLAKDERFDQRLKDASALLVALLFIVHPIQTMAVTYIVQRMTVLAGLFYVLSVYLYALGRLKYFKEGQRQRAWTLIALAVFTGMLGVLSKQNAASFPAAFILYELFFIRRPDGKMCKKYILSSAGAMALAFLFVLFSGLLPAETANFSRMEYLSAQFGVFHKYLLLILFPISQNADYFIRVEAPLFGAAQFLGIALIIGLLSLGFYLFKRNKLISFGIFWFLLSMSIESSIIPIRDIMMEHRMYLPMAGIGMIIAGLIMRYVRYKSITMTYVIGGVLIILLMVGTYNRNKVWESDLSLWKDSLEKNPANPRAMNNYGLAIKINSNNAMTVQERQRDLQTAIDYFTNSMQGDTVFVQAHLNRGLAWFELGDYRRAMLDINKVVENKPEDEYLLHYIEGVVLAKQGEIQAARTRLETAAGMNDKFAPLYSWCGLVYEELKLYQKAVDSYHHALSLDPAQTILCINISNMYFWLEEHELALKWYKTARDAGEQIDNEYLYKLERLVASQKGPLEE